MSDTTVKLSHSQQIRTGKRAKRDNPMITLTTYLTTFVAGIVGGILIKEVKK